MIEQTLQQLSADIRALTQALNTLNANTSDTPSPQGLMAASESAPRLMVGAPPEGAETSGIGTSEGKKKKNPKPEPLPPVVEATPAEPAQAEAAPVEAAPSAAPDNSSVPAKQLTAADIRTLALAVAAEHGRDRFMELLSKYGVMTLKELLPAHYAGFYAEMEAIMPLDAE